MSHFKKALDTVKDSEIFRSASAIYETPAGSYNGLRATASFLKPLNRVSENPYGAGGGAQKLKQSDISGFGVIESENLSYDLKSMKTNELLRVNTPDEKGYVM
jgi:hypothetical protein